MSHAKYVMLLEKKLFLAPITSQPQRILDLGTGTGIWAINVRKYSNTWSILERENVLISDSDGRRIPLSGGIE